MSLQALTWAFEQYDIPSPAKFILLVLANYADREGVAFPSQAHIAKATCLTRQTVNEHLGKLEAAGKITIIPVYTEAGAYKSFRYQLNMPLGEQIIRRDAEIPAFVYVATARGVAKVGVTRQVAARIKALSSAGGQVVELVESFAVPTMAVARQIERDVLAQFAAQRRAGEWLDASAADVIAAVRATISSRVVSGDLTPPGVGEADSRVSARPTGGVGEADRYTKAYTSKRFSDFEGKGSGSKSRPSPMVEIPQDDSRVTQLRRAKAKLIPTQRFTFMVDPSALAAIA